MRASVRRADRVIRQYGDVADLAGCDTVDLSDGQVAALRARLAAPNGGVVLNADASLTALPPPPAPAADPRRTRLAQLRAKGWANLTLLERDEATRLLFELAL